MTAEVGGPCLLRDGSMVEIRQVECGDAALLADGFARLSARSRRSRFMRDKRHAVRALDLHRDAGNRLLAAGALGDVGYCYALTGNYRQAIAHCELSLAQLRAFGAAGCEAAVWHSLGYTYHRLGRHRRAVDCLERSLQLTRTLCDRFHEAAVLGDLGDVQRSAGDAVAARRAWVRALRVLKEIEHPYAERVNARLAADHHGLMAEEAR